MTDAYCNAQKPSKQQRKRKPRKTNAEFISQSKAIHGNKYSYGKTQYTTAHNKVVITCKKHGDFEQAAHSHLAGYGCKKCSHDALRSNKDDFVSKAKAVHGSIYSYEKVVYRSAVKAVTITCKVHGDFEQKPHHHLQGCGCPRCQKSGRKKTTGDFIEQAVKIHSDKYDYSKVTYITATKKVLILCKKHGEFKQTPHKHLLGHGCPDCGNETVSKKNRLNTAKFVKLAKRKHKGKYSYSKTEYTYSNKKVVITCPKHGDFLQEANSHLQGKGCLKCGRENLGYSRSNFQGFCDKNNKGDGFLYVIQCQESDGSVFFKVGITSLSVKIRFKGNDLPYSFQQLYVITGGGGFIYDIEKRLHSLLKNFSYQPNIKFGGETECFTTIEPIEPLLKELTITDQMQLIA